MVVSSLPILARHIFQACPLWIYTQSNITKIILLKSLNCPHPAKNFKRGKTFDNSKFNFRSIMWSNCFIILVTWLHAFVINLFLYMGF
jgi:hypothetical protein